MTRHRFRPSRLVETFLRGVTVPACLLRYGDFTTLPRQFFVEEPPTESADIYRLGCFLPGRERLVSRPLRLLGLGVSSLREPQGRQLTLL